ncbi:MAG: hypothetical protein ACK499_13830, partial [Betaproteobacteria bacterium]
VGASTNSFTAGQTALSFTGLTIPAKVGAVDGSCTVSIVVQSNTPGTHPNQTNAVFSNEAPPSAVSNTANLTVTAQSPAIAKAFSPSAIAAGATSTMSFTITNPNSVALTGANFTDTLVNMSVAGAQTITGCGGSNSLTNGQTALSFTGLTIPAAGNCTINVTVTSSTPGVLPNTASGVASAQAATGAVSNTANLTVYAAPTIAKAFVTSTIAVGGTSQINFTITNPNSVALTGANFADTLTNMFISATGSATGSCVGASTNSFTAGQTGLITIGGLTIPAKVGSVDGSCTVSIVVQSNTPGTHSNQASAVFSNEAPPSAPSNAVNLTVYAAPTIAKAFVTPTIAVGGTSQINFTITNPNSVALTGANFTDTLTNMFISATGSATGSCVGASTNSFTAGQTGLITIGGLTIPAKVGSVNGSCTVSIVVQSNTPGTHPNQANAVFSNEAPPSAPSNAVNLTVTAPDLTIAKTPSSSIFTVGTNAFFTLTPSNVGTSATSGVITVVDTLPTGLSYVSAGSGGTDWGCGVSGQVVTCTSTGTGIINAGGTGNPITINVQVLSTAVPSVTNSVTISGGGEPAANISNNSALAIVSVSSAPVNTFFPSGARSGPPGSAVFYPHTFAAGIAGAVAFSASRTADPNIPGWGVQLYRDNNCNAVLDESDGTVEISGTSFTVLVGGQVCLIVKSIIPITAPEGVGAKDVISVTAAFTPSGGAVATLYGLVDTTTVGGGLGLVKSVKNVTQAGSAGTSNSAKPGDELEYEITYSSGLYALTKIVVSDQIPAYTTLVVDPLVNAPGCVVPLPNDITKCTVVVTGATITWTLEGTLSPSQTGKVRFRVKVNQ